MYIFKRLVRVVKSSELFLTTAIFLIFNTAFAQSNSFVVTNVNVFDGESLHPNSNVIVRDGKITSLGELGKVDDISRIDGTGSTLMPGLLDAHTHTEGVGQLRDALLFGVTTVFDMGTFPPYIKALQETTLSTRTDIADFRTSGVMAAAPGGHGTEFGYDIPTVSGPEQASGFVRDRVQEGASYLKIVLNGVRAQRGMPTLDAATVAALVKSAREHDMLVFVHVESEADVKLAVAEGVDSLVHHWRDAGAKPELAKLILSNDISVMPTLTAIDGMLNVGPQRMLNDKRVNPYLSELSQRELAKEMRIPNGVTMKLVNESTLSLIDAGVTILSGSDAFTGNPRIVHGVSLHLIMELLVNAGLSPIAALQSATANVADVFGLADRGRIKRGLRADMVLVRGDPTVDITASLDILKIWKQGVEVERAK